MGQRAFTIFLGQLLGRRVHELSETARQAVVHLSIAKETNPPLISSDSAGLVFGTFAWFDPLAQY